MAWPTSTDYYAAVQHLRANTGDEELRGGEAARTPRRKLLVWTGSFADVYRIDCPATGDSWALKCFTREVPGLGDRYRLIASHLHHAGLPFTVDFRWLEQGLRIHGQWFPALKMRWVEGLTLTQYVEKYLEQPQNLQLLLSPWVKLAAMLREAEIAHADLQHGNVLLVPAGDSLALRLIDYDGMWVPALAGSRSGEVGHPAYQHPQRLREGTYNAHVDRFSHLAIYTAIRCLMLGRAELWQQSNNGDNLLFREQDFRKPGSSQLLHALWERGDTEVRSLVGRLVLACSRQLEEVPWIDVLVNHGQVRALTAEETRAVGELLSAGEAAQEGDAGESPASAAIASEVPAGPPPLPVMARPSLSVPQQLRRDLFRPVRALDRALGKLAGEGNDLLHNFFRFSAVSVLVVCIAWTGILGARRDRVVSLPGDQAELAHTDSEALPQGPLDQPESSRQPKRPPGPELPPSETLRLKPIGGQTVEAGKLLRVAVSVEGAEQWKGRLRFNCAPKTLRGARIDPDAGLFTWAPDPDYPAGKHEVVVSVEGPDGRRAQTSFTITVAKPASPLAIAGTSAKPDQPSVQKEIAVDVGGGVKLELVRIPAGEFMMGDERGGDSEKPVHRVRITRPFYLGKYEVTQEQWQAVMGNNPSRFKGSKNPVENVSWDDCRMFLERLNAWCGRGGENFGLPTEAQWEYACRAGSATRYCFGDDESQLDEYAWYENAAGKTHPVGGKKPNAWGLYDMHGNVWEWCADWSDGSYYAKSPTDDPRGPATGSYRVLRGQCWGSPPWPRRSSLRAGGRFGGDGIGFRVSRVSADGLPLVREPIRLKPVGLQTAVVGKELTVNISVDNAEHSQGKLEFKLASESTPDASVDPKTGQFLWTPSVNEPVGKHEVTVSVEGPEGRTSQVPFSIAVIHRAPHAEPSVPRAKEIKVELGDGAAMEMLLIPVGSFVMGDDNGENREKPAHKVFMTQPFYLGKYEVTQEQWQAIMGDNPSEFKEPKNPVEGVSWNDCQRFLRKLNNKLCPDEAKFGLPTEAQWEYACRAGGTSRYHFGNDEKSLDEYAWYADNTGGRTHFIGQKKPNAWGLYDMHGNVWEWCEDRYGEDYYTTSPRDDPAGPIDGSFRVLRGGAWDRYSWHCRAGTRHVIAPGVKDMRMGFRVFRIASE